MNKKKGGWQNGHKDGRWVILIWKSLWRLRLAFNGWIVGHNTSWSFNCVAIPMVDSHFAQRESTTPHRSPEKSIHLNRALSRMRVQNEGVLKILFSPQRRFASGTPPVSTPS